MENNKVRLGDDIRLTLANVNFHQDKMTDEQKNDVISFLKQNFVINEYRTATILVRKNVKDGVVYDIDPCSLKINQHFVDELVAYLRDEGFEVGLNSARGKFGFLEIYVALNKRDLETVTFEDLGMF